MPQISSSHHEQIVIGWIIALVGAIFLSRFGVSKTVLLSFLAGSTLIAVVLLSGALRHDQTDRD